MSLDGSQMLYSSSSFRKRRYMVHGSLFFWHCEGPVGPEDPEGQGAWRGPRDRAFFRGAKKREGRQYRQNIAKHRKMKEKFLIIAQAQHLQID